MDTLHHTSNSRTWLGRIVLFCFIVVSLLPLWIALKTALTPNHALFESAGRIFPSEPTLFNFQRVLGLVSENDPRLAQTGLARINFFRILLNSAVFTALVIYGYQQLVPYPFPLTVL